jgi:hypothetical protein
MQELETSFFNYFNALRYFNIFYKKSPRRKARAFHPLEWYYDSIGCGWG